jgi:hypothetical protein
LLETLIPLCEVPVERFEPSTLAGLVFETSAYTVPPHRLVKPIERLYLYKKSLKIDLNK